MDSIRNSGKIGIPAVFERDGPCRLGSCPQYDRRLIYVSRSDTVGEVIGTATHDITRVSTKVPRKGSLTHPELAGSGGISARDVTERDLLWPASSGRFLAHAGRVCGAGADLITGVIAKVTRKRLLAHLDLAGSVGIVAWDVTEGRLFESRDGGPRRQEHR